ncbi:MAG: hypothetical protein LBH32_11135 [Dysgonamonadaceae bacterium]|jgi:hypothetical protein|nr:hypothetical protein [Dysgonamonadaceae bacterium]
MMRKFFRLLGCTAVIAILLTACKNEEMLLDSEFPVEKGKLSFVLPLGGNQGSVTYAAGDPIKGSDAEYNLKNLRLFWFVKTGTGNTSADYTLHQRFGWGDGTTSPGLSVTPEAGTGMAVTQGQNHAVATIIVGDDHSDSRFYMIANINDGVGGTIVTDALDGVIAGSIKADAFEAMASNALAESGGLLAHLKTPLPMSIKDTKAAGSESQGGYISVSDPSGQGIVDNVYLKRRVARFDIINTSDYSHFRLTNVIVKNAQTTGFLHDRPFSDAASMSPAWTTGTTVIDASGANGPESSKVDSNHNGEFDDFELPNGRLKDSTEVLTPSVFYLYPTVLSGSDESKTQISLEGVFLEGSQRIVKLDLPADVNIDANKVYRIRVVPSPNKVLNLELTVLHWEEADTVTTAAAGNNVISWGALVAGTDTIVSDMGNLTGNEEFEYAASDSVPVTLTIQTTGTNLTLLSQSQTENHVTAVAIQQKDGTVAGTNFIQSDLSLMTSAANIQTNTVLTYGNIYYTTTHVINLPPTNAPIKTTLKLYDAVNTQQYKTVTLYSNNYAKTGYAPVKVGGVLWAPVNVGATLLPDTVVSGTGAGFPPVATTNGQTDSVGLVNFYRQVGGHFQWGRNVMFYGNPVTLPAADMVTKAFTTYAGSLDSVIFCAQKGDWLSPWNADLWQDYTTVKPNPKAHPTPPGWRIPDLSELTILKDRAGRTNLGWVKIPGDEPGKYLFLPSGGFRSTSGVLSNAWGQATGNGYYYHTTIESGGASSLSTNATSNLGNSAMSFTAVNSNRTDGRSLRAVCILPQP